MVVIKNTLELLIDRSMSYNRHQDFDARVMKWLDGVAEKSKRWIYFLKAGAAAGKTHANITIITGFGDLTLALSANFTTVCSLFQPKNRPACVSAAAGAISANGAQLDYYLQEGNGYLAACARYRPNSCPGLVCTPDGDAAYRVLLRSSLGFEGIPMDIYKIGSSRSLNTVSQMTSVSGYSTVQQVSSALRNSDNSTLFVCGTTPAEASKEVTVSHV